MVQKFEQHAADEAAMQVLGAQLAQVFTQVVDQQCLLVYLEGDLGAGKTTLSRGVLRGLGHSGAVKSPTYTLVEPYALTLQAYHFDLYRLGDPEELEYMGIRDYFSEPSLSLIEWPSKGLGILPEADILIDIRVVGRGRGVTITANSEQGQVCVSALCASAV